MYFRVNGRITADSLRKTQPTGYPYRGNTVTRERKDADSIESHPYPAVQRPCSNYTLPVPTMIPVIQFYCTPPVHRPSPSISNLQHECNAQHTHDTGKAGADQGSRSGSEVGGSEWCRSSRRNLARDIRLASRCCVGSRPRRRIPR